MSATLLLGAGCMVDYYDEYGEYDEKTESHSSYIVNGTINNGDPAVAMLFLGGGTCSGTMVTTKIMMTARHCVVDQNGVPAPVSDMSVGFGTTPTRGDATSIPVASYEYHPNADIAIVELASPAAVTPIPMNSQDLKPLIGQDVRVTGYGVTGENNRDSGTKRVGVTKLDTLTTEPGFGEIMYIGVTGSKTCYGDSGGPAFMTLDGVEYLVGVTSFGTGVCEAAATRDGQVRIDSYQADLIMPFVNAKDPEGLPVPGEPGSDVGVNPGQQPVTGIPQSSNDLVGGCSVGGSSGAGSLAPLLIAALFFSVRRRRS